MGQDLYLVVIGIYDAMKSTIWVGLVLIVVVYVFAIFCVMFIGKSDERLNYPGFNLTEEKIESSIEDFNPYTAFGSMDKAMFTLFNIAILAEWPEIVRPIYMKQPVLMIAF